MFCYLDKEHSFFKSYLHTSVSVVCVSHLFDFITWILKWATNREHTEICSSCIPFRMVFIYIVFKKMEVQINQKYKVSTESTMDPNDLPVMKLISWIECKVVWIEDRDSIVWLVYYEYWPLIHQATHCVQTLYWFIKP